MNIVWSAPADCSGYSSCGREYVLALNSIGIAVQYKTPIVSSLLDGMGIDSDLRKELVKLISRAIPEPFIRVSHSVPDRFEIDSNALLNIGYTVVETEKIPSHWEFLCNKMDALFTASTFCKQILINNGVVVPIFVIPHCHNPNDWEIESKYNINNLRSWNFLFMADMTPRKGWKHLIKAYCEAFTPEDDVSLTFKAYYHDFSPESQYNCKKAIREVISCLGYEINKTTAPIYFYGHCLPNNCIPKFINTFDCVVSPHSAEGWSLIDSQAMLLGKPVIATKYSGNLEFMNEENSYLIPIGGYEKVPEDMIMINPNYAGQEWAIISIEKLKEAMREVYNNRIKAKQKGLIAKSHIKKNFNYETVANKICEAIQELLLKKEGRKEGRKINEKS